MKKIRIVKKIMCSVLALAAVASVLAGCEKAQSVVYDVGNGDRIKLSLDATDGYRISDDGNGIFSFYMPAPEEDPAGGEIKLAEGCFRMGDEAGWKDYVDLMNGYGYEVIDGGPRYDSDRFYIYVPDVDMYCYSVVVPGSQTVLSVVSYGNRASLEDVLGKLAAEKVG